MTYSFDVNHMLNKLLSARQNRKTSQQRKHHSQHQNNPQQPRNISLAETDIYELCHRSRELFLSQPMLLELEAPICVAGDTHGQFTDVLRLFSHGGYPPSANWLFLGDYVDRGKQSIETICLLLCYRVKYPSNFFLLRGNHECALINRVYGFYDECKRRYSVRLWKAFQDVFNCMPVSALIDDRILCMHGGISPDLKSFDAIRNAGPRPIDIPDYGLLCDLLWADPDKNVTGFVPNVRGISYIFGVDEIERVLANLDIDLIARAHQVVEDGYEFFHEKKFVTIFSATNYCGMFDNAAGLMLVGDNLRCSFKIIPPSKATTKVKRAKKSTSSVSANSGHSTTYESLFSLQNNNTR